MQVKFRHKFSVKIFLYIWLFVSPFLVVISFINIMSSFEQWSLERDKTFINAYAAILIPHLETLKNPQQYICKLNKNLKIKFYVMSSNNKSLSCSNWDNSLAKLPSVMSDNSFIHDKYIISEELIYGSQVFRLLSTKPKPSHMEFIKKYVAVRFLFSIVLSAIVKPPFLKPLLKRKFSNILCSLLSQFSLRKKGWR